MALAIVLSWRSCEHVKTKLSICTNIAKKKTNKNDSSRVIHKGFYKRFTIYEKRERFFKGFSHQVLQLSSAYEFFLFKFRKNFYLCNSSLQFLSPVGNAFGVNKWSIECKYWDILHIANSCFNIKFMSSMYSMVWL